MEKVIEQKLIDYYKNYPIDHWLYKINYIKNSLDDFQKAKDIIYDGLKDTKDNDCIMMLKTELHFSYYQIVECLFELVFALKEDKDEYLWLNLSRTSREKVKEHQNIIAKIADKNYEDISHEKSIILNKDKEKLKIPFLQYVFFFGQYPIPEMNQDDVIRNIDNIKEYLTVFAKDYLDRKEYNAFKHSNRLYYGKQEMFAAPTGTKQYLSLGKAEDAFNYLDISKKEVKFCVKAFDPERDYELCLLANNLIVNIINLRKIVFHKQKAIFFGFQNNKIGEINKMRSTLSKITIALSSS